MTGKRTSKTRKDIEQEITDRMIEALEGEGYGPWQKPWTSAGVLPTSAQTGRAYRGINVFLLSLTAQARGYESPYWLTFKQAQSFGGSVRKGEKGTLVVFWKVLKKEVETEDGVETRGFPMMRHYYVFNLDQTDGVTLPKRFDLPEREDVETDVAIESILADYVDGPSVSYVPGSIAAYNPAADRISLPSLAEFDSTTGHASTILHELTHSTGHASRLNRFERNGEPAHFGSERYAREELVAEMGAAMLAATYGVEIVFENSAAYVANWLGALKNDKSLVVKAAQQAQKAVDRISGATFEDSAAVETSEEKVEAAA
jgi:antirestriction protein ArdC